MAVLNADKNWNEYVSCAETVARSAEHTVVLTGVEGDRLYVNDPLDGLRKVWTKAEFEAKWELLDRRAISL